MTKNLCVYGFENDQKSKSKNFKSSKKIFSSSWDFTKFLCVILFISQFNYIDSLQYMYYPGFRHVMPRYSLAQTPENFYPNPSLSYGRPMAYIPRVQYATPAYSPYQSQSSYSYPYQTNDVPVASNYAQNPSTKPTSQNPDQISALLETVKNLISKTNNPNEKEMLDKLGFAKTFNSKQIEQIKPAGLETMTPTDRPTEEFIKGYMAALTDIAKRVKMSEMLQQTTSQIKDFFGTKTPSSVVSPSVFVGPSPTYAQIENQKLLQLYPFETQQTTSPFSHPSHHMPSVAQQGLPFPYPYHPMMLPPGYQIPWSHNAQSFTPFVQPEDIPSRRETAHHRRHHGYRGHHNDERTYSD